jgi:hypothetical protein
MGGPVSRLGENSQKILLQLKQSPITKVGWGSTKPGGRFQPWGGHGDRGKITFRRPYDIPMTAHCAMAGTPEFGIAFDNDTGRDRA